MNVVIYARYSSHSQTEQSIEGQLQTCYDYARANGHIVIGEYIDRAQSGTTDSRAEFQRMIADSDKHTFEGVLVYQLDRFARNRYDSAINKAKLKKNGVRVISARENISDDASGILVEGVLESMAEYYSAELSQKIRRGMDINTEKCLSNGSNPGLGYRVDEERRFHIDPEGAAIVREIFEMYASGKPSPKLPNISTPSRSKPRWERHLTRTVCTASCGTSGISAITFTRVRKRRAVCLALSRTNCLSVCSAFLTATKRLPPVPEAGKNTC